MGYFIRSLAGFLMRQWLLSLLVLLAITIQMGFRLSVPLAFQAVFDQAIAPGDLRRLMLIIGVVTGLWIIQTIFSVVQDLASARAGLHIINQIRARMYDLINFLSAGRLQNQSSGDLLSRFSNDLANVEQALVQHFYVFVFSMLNLTLSLILLFIMDWRLAGVALGGMLISLLLPKLASERAKRANYRRKGQEGQLISTIQEHIQAQDLVRSFNLRPLQRSHFDDQVAAFDRRAMIAYRADSMVSRLGSQSAAYLQVVILGTGAYLVIGGSLTIGTLVGFSALLQNLVAAISHGSGATAQLVKGSGSLQRIEEFLHSEPDWRDRNGAESMPRPQSGLSCHDLHFEYEDHVEALCGVDLTCPLGTRSAIVGPSGSGKSTLLKLIMRFEKPLKGHLEVDGGKVTNFSLEAWRNHLGLVPQESFLFQTSLRENIRLGKLSASDQEVEAAAWAAGIHDFIMGLPERYDTIVRERGSNLSGGQRQRIAIARAILRKPAFLVLDEATSALDPATERDICGTFDRIGKDCALISVTHRLHTVSGYEQILVMDHGKVVERGTHAELLAAEGLYRELWDKQQGFEVSADGQDAAIKPERLQKIPLFSEVDLDLLEEISDLMESRYQPQDTLLFSKGDPGEAFYIVVDGMVEVMPYDEKTTKYRKLLLENGDFLGELSLLDNKPRSASVKTLRPTLFLRLGRTRFDQLLARSPDIRAKLERKAKVRRALSS
ncbi:ATP-binding cassette domain-containing protein [Sulfidibacter corallicola]|uniref:ATP-binding cassette domain-containing protein n=1 Tax=Sulfidibacter corallicola TaxID=2818388 RepID=A0A8A4TGL2_SULCO|nr:ATP-binding cassette domain-containing protein [Sulfidibacter corallicola]QTD48657.1 ATP-binding cassette domain-containing protein [Sulfidibacter corallicola]